MELSTAVLHHRTVHLFFLFVVADIRIVRFLYRAVEEVEDAFTLDKI